MAYFYSNSIIYFAILILIRETALFQIFKYALQTLTLFAQTIDGQEERMLLILALQLVEEVLTFDFVGMLKKKSFFLHIDVFFLLESVSFKRVYNNKMILISLQMHIF